MKRFFYYYLIMLVLSISLTTIALIADSVKEQPQKSEFHIFMHDRLQYIIKKEYSIRKVDSIWIGVVNYPQWFVGLSMGTYKGLTFHGKIEGSESLYPTNITQQRWLFNFNSVSQKAIESCSVKLKGWSANSQLEIVLYSQMMNICISSPTNTLHNHDLWYNKCWVKYHKRCKLKLLL